MDIKVTEILNSIITSHKTILNSLSQSATSDNAQQVKLHIPKITKPALTKKNQHSTNPTIKYFQSISKYRIKTPNKATDLSHGTITDNDGENSVNTNPETDTESYKPYSLSQLLTRIHTYKSPQWPISSLFGLSKLTPLYLSSHGWICSEHTPNELRCVTCEQRLMIIIPSSQTTFDIEDEEDQLKIIKAVEDRYVEVLEQTHKDYCPWGRHSVPVEVYQIHLDRILENLEEFKSKYLHNLELRQNANEAYEQLDIELEDTKEEPYFLKHVKSWIKSAGLAYNEKVTLLSLSNWKMTRLDTVKYIANCDACNRRFMVSTSRKENIVLKDLHNQWCRYANGANKLLEMFKIIDGSVTNFQKDQDIANGNDNEGDDQGEDDILTLGEIEQDSKSRYELEDRTAERLDRLREIYFD